MAFGAGLFHGVRAAHPPQRTSVGAAGALVLVAEGLFGLVTLFFPEDSGGLNSSLTATGALHIVFSRLSSLATMLAILLMSYWFLINRRLLGYALYSFISVGTILVSAALAGATIASGSSVGGLMERITIGRISTMGIRSRIADALLRINKFDTARLRRFSITELHPIKQCNHHACGFARRGAEHGRTNASASIAVLRSWLDHPLTRRRLACRRRLCLAAMKLPRQSIRGLSKASNTVEEFFGQGRFA